MCNILLLNLILLSSIMHTPYTVHSQAHSSYTVQFTPYIGIRSKRPIGQKGLQLVALRNKKFY